MKPLLVLLAVFILTLLFQRFVNRKIDWALAGRIGMSAMLLFTAMGHFMFSEGMAMMIPDFIPFKLELVYLTGVFEIVAAIGLLLPKHKVITGRLLIAFFVLVLPANIYAALHQINYEQASFDGSDASYLWFRIPLQLFFILWVYFSSITPNNNRIFKNINQ
jgi:uncharacterized membrane protein